MAENGNAVVNDENIRRRNDGARRNDEVGSPRPVCLVGFASVAAAGLGSPCSVYVRVILPHVHSLSCRGFSLADCASGKPSLMGRRFSFPEFPTAIVRTSMLSRSPPFPGA